MPMSSRLSAAPAVTNNAIAVSARRKIAATASIA
jgi:hypothetical protein